MIKENGKLGFIAHDHGQCVQNSLEAVVNYCAEHHLKLTPMRRRVFEILAQEHKAIGAYDILAELQKEGQPAQPPIVYRALDFLMTHGLVHKIERLNAYLACCSPSHEGAPSFLICSSCHSISEFHVPLDHLSSFPVLDQNEFQLSSLTFEAEGLCPKCQ